MVRSVATFLMVCGFVYGAYALATLSLLLPSNRNDEIETKAKDIDKEIKSGGWRGLIFYGIRPLYWLVMLPMKSVPAALFLAFFAMIPSMLLGK